MRAAIAFLTAVAVAETAALLVLLSAGPAEAPLAAGAGGVETVTVYQTAAAVPPAPVGPATVTPAAELPDDVPALKARIGALELESAQMLKAQLRMREIVTEKTKENEAMRNELEGLRRNGAGGFKVPVDPAPGVADDELTEAQARARALHLGMTRLANLWVIGFGVPEGAWDATQAAGIEAAMRDEMRRRDLVLRDFIQSQLRDEAPANLKELNARQMMDSVIRPRMNSDFNNMQALTAHKHVKLIRGEAQLAEFLGAEAWTVRLSTVLAAMRRRTHGDIARATTSEQAGLITGTHLPLGSYRYSDGVEIEIGASR